MAEIQKFYTLHDVTTTLEGLQQEIDTLAKTGQKQKRLWVFRGQHADSELETTLERYCRIAAYGLEDAPGIEDEMIREFKRLYRGEDRQDVVRDTLYCISVMRHWGAPSRILDFSYSKDVAIYFGLESAYESLPIFMGKPDYNSERSLAVWCIDKGDLSKRINTKYSDIVGLRNKRKIPEDRSDDTFGPLYMENKYQFVCSENPKRLHERLNIQHGVFLCPGNVGKPFMSNLSDLYDKNSEGAVHKFVCKLKPTELRNALESLRARLITRQILFPGLDGFAQSMKYQLPLFKNIHDARTSR